jgi:hypothetical protein
MPYIYPPPNPPPRPRLLFSLFSPSTSLPPLNRRRLHLAPSGQPPTALRLSPTGERRWRPDLNHRAAALPLLPRRTPSSLPCTRFGARGGGCGRGGRSTGGHGGRTRRRGGGAWRTCRAGRLPCSLRRRPRRRVLRGGARRRVKQGAAAAGAPTAPADRVAGPRTDSPASASSPPPRRGVDDGGGDSPSLSPSCPRRGTTVDVRAPRHVGVAHALGGRWI